MLQWLSWQGVVEDGYEISYAIEYMLRNWDTVHTPDWKRGPVIKPADSTYQRAQVTNLQLNQHYYFRVFPYLHTPNGTVHQGTMSPEGGPIRTKCVSPEAPVIGNASSSADHQRKPPSVMLTVSWEGPRADKINCDNIKVFKIFYKKVAAADTSWQIALAGKSMAQQNVTGLEFATAYKVMVAAVNNWDLSSNSAMITVTTVADETAVVTAQPSTEWETALIVGIVIGVVVMLALAVLVVLLKKSKSRYMPVPPKDPEDGVNSVKVNNVCRMTPQARKQDKSPTGDSGVSIDSPHADHIPLSASSGAGSGDMAALVDKQQQAYLADEQRKKRVL